MFKNSKHEKSEFVSGIDPAEADYYELPCRNLPYFFSDKAEFFFPFQNNRKHIDLSYKTDLDLWDCLGRVN